MKRVHRPPRIGVTAAVLGLAMTGAFAASSGAQASPPAPASPPASAYVALSGSAPTIHATSTGSYTSPRMSVELALAPRDQSGLNARLKALYAKGSGSYHQWLAKGQFNALYAPATATRSAITSYLAKSGLSVQPSASPFLVRAVGSSQQVSAAFGTTLSNYRAAGGARFFANSTAVRLPASLAPGVLGVIGLNNASRNTPMFGGAGTVGARPKTAARPKTVARPTTAAFRPAAHGVPPVNACETSYPTVAQLSGFASNGTLFPFGYGGGPGCSGLTPSQVNSIYGAPNVGPTGRGKGITLGLIEFTGYQVSDDQTWAQTFYGSGYTMPEIDNVPVDGGPLNPQCPASDPCPPSINGYAGDLEASLDIQRLLTISPDAAKIITYNAANDTTGQTGVDDYARIASDDMAQVVSNSWASVEAVQTPAIEQAENVAFEQMATQGQTMISAAGDWGPNVLELFNGSTAPSLVDPAGSPWLTAVGGTTLGNYDPGTNPTPGYPAGAEMVWNTDNLCKESSTLVGPLSGFQWCISLDGIGGSGMAGGGGSSLYWGRPSYQTGPGVDNPFTTRGNGTNQCSLAPVGTPCREVPDVSALSDAFTPYADFCVANPSLPNSGCAGSITRNEIIPGWYAGTGTSGAAPLWAGIAADLDSYTGARVGFLNPLLYSLFNTDPGKYFHDITGVGQANQTNGLFPVTPGYDEATGIGTPKMAALITETGIAPAG
ncbi:MAG: S8 family serine peptidase [Streptosporangiaceae bacterium]|nr:S8 family serine peptidase [Streptosporangiaceae bacterium]